MQNVRVANRTSRHIFQYLFGNNVMRILSASYFSKKINRKLCTSVTSYIHVGCLSFFFFSNLMIQLIFGQCQQLCIQWMSAFFNHMRMHFLHSALLFDIWKKCSYILSIFPLFRQNVRKHNLKRLCFLLVQEEEREDYHIPWMHSCWGWECWVSALVSFNSVTNHFFMSI